MIRILKLSLTLLISVLVLAVATWFFLQSSIHKNFAGVSGDILEEISALTDPISGQSSMGKYLSRSGKLIHEHLKVPVFPLITERQKEMMDQVVIERLKSFKKKLESMDGSATGSRVNVYHSVLRTYKEVFPGRKATFDEKLNITIRAIKESEKKGKTILEQAKEISETTKPAEEPVVVPKEEKKVEQKKKIQKPAINRLRKSTAEKGIEEENRTILLSKAAEHIGERVYVYLKTGRKLEGFIKSLSPGFLHLDIEFKGGIFSAKIIRSDIDEIMRVMENSIFKYLRGE